MICVACHLAIENGMPFHGMHEACFRTEFGLASQDDFKDLFERSSHSAPPVGNGGAFQRFNSSFFHGKYRKYSARLGNKNFILKVQQPECPDLPVVEFISNKIAKVLGLPLPDFHFIVFRNKSNAFLSRNLMDTCAPATLDHIYKFIKKDSEFDCQNLSRIIQAETGRISEVYKFVDMCLFDALVGNGDRHGRNIAFVTKNGGKRSLSPLYDNPSYIGIADEDFLGSDLQPRGLIFTAEESEPTLKHYASEFKRLGFSAVVEKFSERARNKFPEIVEIIQKERMLPSKRKVAFLNLLEKRLQELEDA